MKLYRYISDSLNRFRTRSTTHLMGFRWNGSNMKFYQNGSTFILSNLFSGSIMPNALVRGVILPKDVRKFIEVQHFIDNNTEDIIIAPAKWGYDIYILNKEGGNPLLVHELRFYSIKGSIPLFFAKWLLPGVRTALKNL